MHGHKIARPAWIACGILALAFGAAGTVLPLLPTTPFILLSAYAFAQSSPRLHRWLLQHRHFGPLIENWRRYGAISRRTKIVSVAVMATMPAVTWFAGAPGWALGVQGAVLLAAAMFVLTRPDTGGAREDSLPG